MRRATGSSRRSPQAVADAGTPSERLEAAIEAGSTGGLEGDESRILYEFGSAGLRDASLNDADHALYRRQVAVYLEILDEGVAAGVFRPRIDGRARSPGRSWRWRTASSWTSSPAPRPATR